MENKNNGTDSSRRKMTYKEMEPFVKHNPQAYRRFKRARLRNKCEKIWSLIKPFGKAISQIILWFCAVGGFVLALIQFLQGFQN